MMTLYDAIKTIQNAGLCFSSKKKKLVSFQTNKNIRIKKQVGCFLKKMFFFQS